MRALALAVAALVLAAPAFGAGTVRPSLELSGTGRMVVRGLHFAPNETVRLFFNGAKLKIVKVKASARGTFAFPVLVGVDRCRGLLIQAVGSAGSRASEGVLTTGCERGGDMPSSYMAP
jgi:hypothetical protein